MLPSVSGSPMLVVPMCEASAASIPVQVTTVDGLVSTFTVSNVFQSVSGLPISETRFHVGEGSSSVPMVLDFSAAGMANPSAGRRSVRGGLARVAANRSHARPGQPHDTHTNRSPMQGPIAPPQRQGAPIDYKYFGRCDQVCQHCRARFWWEERSTGLPAYAAPQYQRCCAGGRAYFLDENNALVHLFRTARDKLREADIPNFHIRLFGVVGANQYELPTADSIGAIVLMALTGDTSALSKTVAQPPVPQRSFAHFADLNPADNSKFIEARVYRKWTAVKVPSLIATGFSCILLDKKGSAIQANTDLKEKERFEHDLQLNCVYRIQGFGFEKTDGWGKTLDNDFTLCFGKHTQVDLLKDDKFPHHYFNFAAYNELGGRVEKKNPILTDYIGYVHNVEKVKEYGSATGNKIKVRNIAIRNLNNNVVLFTLWNEKADNFEEEEYAKMRQPVILAVSSCYLKTYGGQIQLSATSATSYYFNPPVEETAELLAAYDNITHSIFLAPQIEVHTERLTEWEQERSRNRVPLVTLLQIDPNTQQRVLFTQEVLILQVDNAYDWYYQKCDECGGKLDYGFIHGHCHPYGTQSKPQNSYSFRVVITDGTANAVMTCFSPQTDGLIKDVNTLLKEVTNKDPAIVPPQILALQNTRHVFQFRFAKPTGKGTPTLVLQKVTNKDPAIVPPQILALQNTRHVFQFRFAKPTGKGTPTLVLQKVMDHPPAILPAPAEGPSSPRTISPTDTSSQISPPPTTPATTQETPVDTSGTPNQPTTSAIRKQLFTGGADEDIDSQSKKQKTE
ncbi:hypothetical protein CTI12_AA332110 [Artemisia annua]|uniref:Uncharacterized protein n=1 Tax=Artemisia annua TaxID=35608 RepID=A0A2U1MWF6_ARTAN|nr:hypothetical protein CTI12_AA332110 [Artemisia annua]